MAKKTPQQLREHAMSEVAELHAATARTFRKALRGKIEARDWFMGQAKAMEISARAIRKHLRAAKAKRLRWPSSRK